MKKLLIGPFLLLTSLVFSQTTQNPAVDNQVDPQSVITQVVLTNQYTIISMYFKDNSSGERRNGEKSGSFDQILRDIFKLPSNRNQPRTQWNNISIDPNSFLGDPKSGKQFAFIRADNIPEKPDTLITEPGKIYYFTLYYQRLDAGIETFDLVEGENRPNTRLTYWNFTGVHINNPAFRDRNRRNDYPSRDNSNSYPYPRQETPQPPVITQRPDNRVINKIVVKGRVLDAATKQPIDAMVTYLLENNNRQEVGRVETNNSSGDYRFELQPDSYSYVVSANGYETKEESLDLSKITGSQQFTLNISLNPVGRVNNTPQQSMNNKVTFSGRIFDAKTKLPIQASIVAVLEKNNWVIDSLETSQESGDYRFELQPDSYNFYVSAEGYENSEKSFDWSQITGSQEFTQNIYLTPGNYIQPPVSTQPIAIEKDKFRLDKVYFEVSQPTLLPDSYEQLDGLAKMMKESPTMTIQVEGHTDNVGDHELNRRLSIDRAFAVREYLISKGIAGNRIKFKGYGDTKPIATNDTEEGKARNRRVEFLIITK